MGYQALLFCPDEKTARTVTQVLNDLDFAVEQCSEPFAAVKKLMAQHFDALVVDCDNEQNATLLFKSARTSNSSLAVAVVEGQAGVAKAFRIGANLVLTKPINVEQAKGTLRVARGLLRKGSGEAPKAAVPQVPSISQDAVTSKTIAPAPRPATSMGPATPSFAPGFASRKPGIPATPIQKLSPAIPSIAASTRVAEVDDQDSDAILEADITEPTTVTPAFEAKPAVPMAATPATGTPKFPWQPSAKMAEPMASALRRAAEAAGQIEPVDTEPATPVVAPAAPERRPMTGAMFQAQGHAAAPARAMENAPVAVASASTIEELPFASKTALRDASQAKAEKSVALDTSRDAVPPPTFFPGGYDPDEAEGGGKTKAIAIVAAVVLLASSAGYLSWKNARSKNAVSSAAAQSVTAAAAATSAADAPSSHDSASSASQPVATEITLAGTGTNASAAARPTPSKPSPNVTSSDKKTGPDKARTSQTAASAEPEVTQRLVVRSDTRHMTSTSAPQEQEAVQAPSAIGVTNAADGKALASISNAPVNVPRASPQMLRVSQGVMEGLVLKRVQPRYPTQALQMRIQGPVQLQATISKTGDIENLRVVSGDALLARAAQDAVKQWKYKPYYLNGDPVQIETQILVNFKLPN
jgi:TonB family protein